MGGGDDCASQQWRRLTWWTMGSSSLVCARAQNFVADDIPDEMLNRLRMLVDGITSKTTNRRKRVLVTRTWRRVMWGNDREKSLFVSRRVYFTASKTASNGVSIE